MGIDPESLDAALASIRKAYGKDAVRFGSEKSEVQRIPFHDIQLDWATGGGIPLGRWVHFYGPEASGKTLLALKLIASAQKMGMSAAFYDVEKTFVPSWAAKMGVDVEKLLVLNPTVIEDIGTQLETLMTAVNIHVIDSLPAASPMDELAAKMDDWFMGLHARTWNKVLRRAQHRLQDENCIILINQLRTAFKGRVVVEQPSGGKFLRHEASLALELKRGAWLYHDKKGNLSAEGEKTDSPTGDTVPDGIEFIAKGAKSKVGVQHRTARMRLDFNTGKFDELWSLVMFANYFGFVERSGAWYSVNGGSKVQGEAGLRAYILEHPEFADKIRQAVLTYDD